MDKPITLTPDELYQITGYKLPSRQCKELLRQGFSRARQSTIARNVILEREHYEAVCRGPVDDQIKPIKMPDLSMFVRKQKKL